MSDIAGILGLDQHDERIVELTRDLQKLASKWRSTFQSVPVDFPTSKLKVAPSKRIRWLEQNVEKAARQLIDTLGDENDPYYSIWGTLDTDLAVYDRNALRKELERLRTYAEDLIIDLHKQQNEKAPQTGEMRYEIVWDLVQVIRKGFPDIDQSRGTYQPESGYWSGHLPEFIQAAFSEIVGGEPPPGKKLDNLLTTAITD